MGHRDFKRYRSADLRKGSKDAETAYRSLLLQSSPSASDNPEGESLPAVPPWRALGAVHHPARQLVKDPADPCAGLGWNCVDQVLLRSLRVHLEQVDRASDLQK